MLKQWLGYIFQAMGAVSALLLAPYLQASADLRPYTQYFILGYFATVVAIRITYRRSKWSLRYGQQFFRFMYWFIAILAAILAPTVPALLPFLTVAGIVPKLAIGLAVLILLLLVGVILGISNIFKVEEDLMVERFQNRLATLDYEAILKGEEFDYHPKPLPTRRESLREWWEDLKKQWRAEWRRFVRRIREE